MAFVWLGLAWLGNVPLSEFHEMNEESLKVKPVGKVSQSVSECSLTSYVYSIVNCHQNINLLSGDWFFPHGFALYVIYDTPKLIVKGNFICDLFY